MPDMNVAVKCLEYWCKRNKLGCPVKYAKRWNSLCEAIGSAVLGIK